MIPIGDYNGMRRGRAWLTWIFVGMNIFTFIVIQRWGASKEALALYSLVPAEIAAGIDLGRPLPPFLTLITSMFMHGGFAHIFGNMLFLSIFGDNIEYRIGRLRYLILYLVSGIVGSMAHVGLSALIGGRALYVPLIGASGAIAGVLGAYLVLFPGNRVTVLMFGFIPVGLSAWLVIGLWFFMQVSGALSGWSAGGVAYLAHIGGFVPAWLWARLYKTREAARLEKRRRERPGSGSSEGVEWRIIE